MTVSDLWFATYPRLSDLFSHRTGCVFRNAKTGKNQFIQLSDDALLRRLKRFVLSKPNNDTSLFHLSYADLCPSFSDAVEYFKLSKNGYRLHSLRQGGATFDCLNESTLQDVMMKGRWEAEASWKRYLNAGRALLIRNTISPRSVALLN